jgi:glycosyltransferase involved in cell wall biosynthesis
LNKIKILQLVDEGFLGGKQIQALSILKHLDKNIFECSIAGKGGGRFEEEVRKAGHKFYPLELPKILRQKHLKHLLTLHQSENFNIVHSHGGIAGFYGRMLKKRNPKLRSVHSIHGIHYINSENYIIHHASKAIEQYLVQFSDKIICETKNDIDKAIELKIATLENAVLIKNGVDISKFANIKRNEELRKSLGLTEDNFLIGNISRFEIQKNQKLLIQAAYYLEKKHPSIRFIFVGDGKLLRKMKEYAMDCNMENKIIFAGEVSNISDYYSIIDVMALPSLSEGMSFVLLESMASRVPVICSNIPANLEVVKSNYSALTFNPYNHEDLINKIGVLYKHKEIKQQISQNALVEITQFDDGEMVKKIERVYKEVIQF